MEALLTPEYFADRHGVLGLQDAPECGRNGPAPSIGARLFDALVALGFQCSVRSGYFALFPSCTR